MVDRRSSRGDRAFLSRTVRFLRARASSLCNQGRLLADEPRVWRAWRRGWDPSHLVRLLRWRDEGFRPQVIYDIGAYEGVWSEMAQWVYSPRSTILFEPQKKLQSLILKRKARLNSEGWIVQPVALGVEEKQVVLTITENCAASSLLTPIAGAGAEGTKPVGQEEVFVRSLDNLAASEKLPSPDFVKIDVQGYEGGVLSGGIKTLGRAERIVVEVSLEQIYEGQPLLAEILNSLTLLGFRLDDISETYRSWPCGCLLQADLWLKRA